jgi:hypothetical protein
MASRRTSKSKRRREIESIVYGTIERLLTLKQTYDLTSYQLDKLILNWKEIEHTLHGSYPISDAGVIATLSAAEGVEGLQPDDFLITDEPAAPEDVVSALGAFPLEAACCAFVFTILERFGDDLVALINPRFSQQRKSWHRDIQGGSKVGGPSKERKLRIAFATPFKIRQSDISRQILLDLMTVKMQRNAFAHGGSMTLSLSEFFRRVMRVICFISLKVMPEEHILVVHRSGDYSGRFAEALELQRMLEEGLE